MANLRDIINSATPGPWRLLKSQRAEFIITADQDDDYPLWVASSTVDRERDARFIAAYSPDHALLIEDVLAAGVVDEFGYETDEYRALTAYRKERGLDG